MKSKLTPELERKIEEFRDEMFAQVTCTEPADRERAEKAARCLADILGFKVSNVIWVSSPRTGAAAFDTAWEGLKAMLRAQLGGILTDTLLDDITGVLNDNEDRDGTLLGEVTLKLTEDPEEDLADAMLDHIRFHLSEDMQEYLGENLMEALQERLYADMKDSLTDDLSDNLADTLISSMDGLPWISLHTFFMSHTGIEYTPEVTKMFNLHQEISASCFAMWIVPGTVILCDRPETVEVKDGHLIDMTWRGGQGVLDEVSLPNA